MRLSDCFGVKGGMVYQREINIQTRGHKEMHDLTGEVARIVGESKVRQGIAHVFNIGSTGAIGTIEFEPGLEVDLPEMLDKLIPPSRSYGHERAWHVARRQWPFTGSAPAALSPGLFRRQTAGPRAPRPLRRLPTLPTMQLEAEKTAEFAG